MPSTTISSTSNASMYGATTARPTNAGKDTNIKKLSTGSRINTASDDAAGLGIADRLKDEIAAQRVAAAGGFTLNNSASPRYTFNGQLPTNNENSVTPPHSPAEEYPQGGNPSISDSGSYQAGYTGGGVSNTAGAPSGPSREQALERYQATESSNSSGSSLRMVRG